MGTNPSSIDHIITNMTSFFMKTLDLRILFSKNFEIIKEIKESQQAAENSSFLFKIIGEEEVKNATKDFSYKQMYYFW